MRSACCSFVQLVLLVAPVYGQFLLDTTVYYRPEASFQEHAAVAFDGSNCFAVWLDCRQGMAPDVYGARITRWGEVLDRAGIPITSRAQIGASAPAVAFDGTNFLVAWEDMRNGNADIYAARVSPNGGVLDPQGIAVCTDANAQTEPTVAFGQENFVVAWQDQRTGVPGVYCARVNTGGAVLDSTGIKLAAGSEAQVEPAIAFDGTDYLVVWEAAAGDTDIYGCRVSEAGAVVDTAVIPVGVGPGRQASPAAAFDGSNYLVVWQDNRSDAADVFGARVSPGGMVLDSQGIAVAQASSAQTEPAVAFSGSNWLVAWADSRNDSPPEIRAARVDGGGAVLDPEGILLFATAYSRHNPVLAFDGTNSLVLWQGGTPDPDIIGCRVDQSGIVLDTAIKVSTAASPEYTPSLSFDGTDYLAVWRDMRTGYSDIYGTRITDYGAVLDPHGIAISKSTGAQRNPRGAFGRENYLIVWQDYRAGAYDIYGARVTGSGVVLDTGGIPISTAAGHQRYPAVAWDGTNFLVVWQDKRTGSYDIYGSRVTTSGAVLDPAGIAVSCAANDQTCPQIAFDGDNYLVVWQDQREFLAHVYAARVSRAGGVLDTAGILITDTDCVQEAPCVAFGGANYLVVWQDWRGNDPPDIYGARVSPGGSLIDSAGIPICVSADYQQSPAITFDGADHTVMWEDRRNGGWDIRGAVVGPNGAVFDSLALALHDGDQNTPAAVSGRNGQLLAAWSGWTDIVYGRAANTFRIWARLFSLSGIGIARSETRPRPAFTVAPNPCRGVLRISLQPTAHSSQRGIIIFDRAGREVRRFELGACAWAEKDVGDLPPGVYILKLEAWVGGEGVLAHLAHPGAPGLSLMQKLVIE